MLFQCLCGIQPIFYSTHPNEEPLNHMNLDRAIFKSGTPVVEPEMLNIFNRNIINIEHIF